MMGRWVGMMALFASFFLLQGLAYGGEPGTGRTTMNSSTESRIRMTFDGREATAVLYDHPATRDLLSRLPLTLPFKDYVGVEKISYLDSKLVGNGTSPTNSGDFAYYAPWGNLALFYRGAGTAGGGLVILGSIETGKEELAAMKADFTMTLERVVGGHDSR